MLLINSLDFKSSVQALSPLNFAAGLRINYGNKNCEKNPISTVTVSRTVMVAISRDAKKPLKAQDKTHKK